MLIHLNNDGSRPIKSHLANDHKFKSGALHTRLSIEHIRSRSDILQIVGDGLRSGRPPGIQDHGRAAAVQIEELDPHIYRLI